MAPVRAIFLAFTAAAWVGVALLMLPIAKRDPGTATFIEAFFTATSAICVTGLNTVDTFGYWTPFGQVVIAVLIQVGGFGVMTLASLVGLTVLRRLSLGAGLHGAAEAHAGGFGDLRRVLLSIFRITVTVESVTAAMLALRLWLGYGFSPGDAVWHGIFHAISAFNNAGFALYSDSITRFAADPMICLPLALTIIIGGLGFPVLHQLRKYPLKLLKWTMNTRLVVVVTIGLLAAGWLYISVLEWNNPATLGHLPWGEKLLAGFFQSVQTRTAGFNSVDIGAMHPATWIGMDILMFIGTGPAGTGGGIKVTTFAVLFFILWAEVRGDTAVHIFGKRLARSVHRQAISVALLAIGLVITATTLIVLISPYSLDEVLFEVISAFATVGLTTGITPTLDPISQVVLCVCMYLGRLGPITFASALALRNRTRLYELPKERPIIG